MDFRVPHQVTYEIAGRASVSEVAKSLVAQEKLFKEAIQVLEECFPELEIERADITVREIVQNSPLRHRLEGIVISLHRQELFTRETVKADVLVTSVLDNEGDYIPSIYYLSKVHDDHTQGSPR